MALITCYECGKQLSDAAPACPSCGAPKKEELKKRLTILQQEEADGLSAAERARRAKNRAEWGISGDVVLEDEVDAMQRTLKRISDSTPRCPLCGGVLMKMGGVEGLFRGGITGVAKKHRCNSCGHL